MPSLKNVCEKRKAELIMLWIVAGTLLVIWIVLLLLGKGGFIHVLPLSALALIVAQTAANRRAAM